MKTTLMMTALLASLSLGTVTQAQTPDALPRAGAPRPMDAPERPDFATLDSDGNGTLTVAEMQDEAKARFAAADADANGGLSVQELLAQADQRRADRMARMIANRDTNGDGLLQADEMAPKGDRMARMFAMMDADDDGTVSAAEYEAAADRMARGGRGRGDREGRGHAEREGHGRTR